MRKSFPILLSALICITQFSCKFWDEDEDSVVYVKITDVNLDPGNVGGNSDNAIRDVWVEIDGLNIGAYEIPGSIPLIINKATTVRFLPGIAKDGFITQRQIPIFLDATDTVLSPDGTKKEVNYTPTFTFTSGISDESLFSDFNSGAFNSFELIDSSQSEAVFQNVPPIYGKSGQYSLYLYAKDSLNKDLGIIERFERDFDSDLRYCVAEITYRCNVPIKVGFEALNSIGIGTELYSVVLFPSDQWNRTNIDLYDEASVFGTSRSYKLFIQSEGGIDNNAFIGLDNVRLIYDE